MPEWASWLLAPPQMILAFSRARFSSLTAPPSAHGEKTSRGRLSRSSRSAATSTAGCLACTRSTAPALTSQITTWAPASTRWSTRRCPTLPTPSTPTVRPSQAARAPGVLGGRAHALEHPERGQHRGVARAAVRHRAAGHVPALPGHDVHVLAVGADVTGGDVPAVQRLHEPAVGAQQRLGLQPQRVADDDRLAAAVIKARHGVLVRHRARQVEHVGQGRVLARVRVEPGPAQRRAERGRVDRDDGAQPASAGPGRTPPARGRRARARRGWSAARARSRQRPAGRNGRIRWSRR